MALDDFDDEDELEDLEEGSPEAVAELDSFGENEGESVDLDEDLFDFPDPHEAAEFDYTGHGSGVFASGAAASTSEPLAPPSEPGAPLPEPVAGSKTESAASLLSSTDVPSGSNAANHDLSPLSPRSPYHDSAVDEDLYDFPDVFAGGRSTEEVSPATDLPPPRPLDPLGLGLDKGKARGEESAPPPPAESGTPGAPAAAATPGAEPTFTAAGPLTVAPPTTFPTSIPTTARGRLLEVLAVAFLVLNTGLVLFAWQANSSFHDTLEAVTRNVSETLAAGRSAQAPVVVPMPVPDAGAATPNEAPSPLTDYSIESLEAARELLAAGRYMDARRRLYRLLANADAAGIEPRVTTEAEFLIAESYELQGRALAEEGR